MKSKETQVKNRIMKIYFALFYTVVSLSAIVFVKPTFKFLVDSIQALISSIKAIDNSAVGGLILLWNIFWVPILFLLIVGIVIFYVSVIAILFYKRKKKNINGLDCIVLIVTYIFNAFVEGLYYETKNILYYLSGCMGWLQIITFILFIAIFILNKIDNKKKEV